MLQGYYEKVTDLLGMSGVSLARYKEVSDKYTDLLRRSYEALAPFSPLPMSDSGALQ